MSIYNIINLGSLFKEFWDQAHTKTLNEKIKLWNEIVEEPNCDVYDYFVWRKPRGKNLERLKSHVANFESKWKESKQQCLQPYFEKIYPQYFDKIYHAFENFDTIFHEQVVKFKKYFKNLNSNFSVYALPSPKFDGIFGNLKKSGFTVAFGLDNIALSNKIISVIIAHELFHIYQKDQIMNKSKNNCNNITISLWADGLATYVSSILNPTLNDGDILSNQPLANISKKNIAWLIQEFIKDAQNSSNEVKVKWFYIGSQKVRKDLPYRCGYLLGLYVIRELHKNYNLNKITNIQYKDAHELVINTLENLLSKYS